MGKSACVQGRVMPSIGQTVPGGHLVHSPASRNSQFLDQVPCGHPAQITPVPGVPDVSPITTPSRERKVPGGQMVATAVASFSHCVPGGQG